MDKKQIWKKCGLGVAVVLMTFLISFSGILYNFDRVFSDPLYQKESVPEKKIMIIAIDEKTIARYGDSSKWNRDIYVTLMEQLNQDKENAPAVIAFDILFVGDKDAVSDEQFASVCEKAGNVITAVNVVYKTDVSLEGNTLKVDAEHIDFVEYPYEALKGASVYGFANTHLDSSGVVRYANTEVLYQEERIPSFATAVYEKYMKTLGKEAVLPVGKNEFFTFSYVGRGGTYEVVSLCDVLDGKIDVRAFRDRIVFVGAYAPGMQDAYSVPIDKSNQMYGVEIHANILEALLEGRTVVAVDPLLYALGVALIALIFYILSERLRIVATTVSALVICVVSIGIAYFAFGKGLEIRIVEPVLAILLIYAARLVLGYVLETLKKRRILSAFRKYVAPEVVEEIARKGDYTVQLGGESRHIAVLFVDIRGFTPMSEGLAPETVVEILNEYLNLTTNAIFKNRGTLDKFIGDATMAVFNAPFDLDDYIYRAVCTAWDIAQGSAALEKKLMERFGRSISFGIGVNCGDAVVGNIGCDARMDYTAIGDTVNTAARLESNAKRGQILISQSVYEAVKERVDASPIGVIPLKGKSNEIFVYEVNGLRN